jgi:hypothetical protein
MFFPAPPPADRDIEGLRALRRSLNSPVVAIEMLPTGPASAAIVLHGGPGDRPRVTIALRSARSGQLAFFTADEERAQFGSPAVALDAALSFAESMGFLFDDDEVEAVGDDGPAHAARFWRAFVSTDAPWESSQAPGAGPDELLLEEIDVVAPGTAPDRPVGPESVPRAETAPEEVEIAAREADPPDQAPDELPPVAGAAPDPGDPGEAGETAEAVADPGPPAVDPVLLLTKFRRVAGGPGAPEAPDGRSNAHIRMVSRF